VTRKKLITLVVSLIIASFVAGLFGGWFYLKKHKTGPEELEGINYLIPGVPYNGFYNLYFQRADTAVISSIMDILGYWGDKRFDLSDIKERFPIREIFSTLDIKSFFEENGYQTERWISQQPGGEIERIKKFVNPTQKAPVIVFQKVSPNPESTILRFRIVIGILDQEQKVIVHDHYFGNNYEISYQDFETMFQPDARAILAVWPTEYIEGSIEGPNYETSYSPRLESMDKIGDLLVNEALEAAHYNRIKDFEKTLPFYAAFVNGPDFQYFPPAFRVSILSFWASWHLDELNQPDEAIKIINERVSPLNHDLDKPIEGWFITSQDKLASPYYVLARAYLQKGERELAVQNYEEMKKVEVNFNQDDYQAMLEKLEKELNL